MKQVHALLTEGQGEAARHRLHTLLAQEPDKSDAAADVITGLLGGCYDQFQVKAVHEFCRDMEMEFPRVVCERIQKTIGPRIQRTADWTNILRGVTRERLVRECRDAIIHKDLKKAAIHGATLLERAHGAAELDDSAVLLARGLATLPRDRDSALTVVGYLMRAGNKTHAAAPIVADQFTQMSREFRTVSFANDNQEWHQQLTDAILAFRSCLPGMNEVGEPEAGQVERFHEEAHACLRAGMHHHNREDFIDALAVLMEYCPTDPPMARNAAGVEERMFLKIGPRAKLVAVRGMGRLGESTLLRKMVLQLAKEDGGERIRLLASIMGGLRHADFYPYLRVMLDRVDNRRDEARVIEAIGRIANPEAVKTLLERLSQSVKRIHTPGLGKAIPVYTTETNARELSPEDRVALTLTALGRIARFRGVAAPVRNEIIKRTIELLDREDRKLAFQAASELFSVRLEELDPGLKNWAAQKAVEAMWGQPLSAPDAASANGWREPMVTLLMRLGREALPAVLAEAAKHATRYSGAMVALANTLAETGDPSAVPVLETMLRTAFLHQDEVLQSKLTEERVIDAASGETRGLDRDELIHTLLYTILKAGETDGIKVVLDYADQVQGGRLHSPGPQTINMLVDVKLKLGRMELRKAEEAAPEVDPKALKQALAQAKGGLLTRKATQIAAIAQLGQMKQLAGVPVLLELLGEKDPMVASAAHTALAQFLNPLPGEKPYGDFLDSMLERTEPLKGGRIQDKFLDFVNRELPKNPPYDRLLERQMEIMLEDEGELVHRIRAAMRRPKSKDLLERVKSESLRPTGGEEPEEQGVFIDDDRMTRQTGLDQRRVYYEARRQWVRNGKVGDPPRPPGGVE